MPFVEELYDDADDNATMHSGRFAPTTFTKAEWKAVVARLYAIECGDAIDVSHQERLHSIAKTMEILRYSCASPAPPPPTQRLHRLVSESRSPLPSDSAVP